MTAKFKKMRVVQGEFDFSEGSTLTPSYLSFYLPPYGSKLGNEINMKKAQTRDVRVSSKGQGGWEKERARGGCAVQKDFLVGFVGHSLSL